MDNAVCGRFRANGVISSCQIGCSSSRSRVSPLKRAKKSRSRSFAKPAALNHADRCLSRTSDARCKHTPFSLSCVRFFPLQNGCGSEGTLLSVAFHQTIASVGVRIAPGEILPYRPFPFYMPALKEKIRQCLKEREQALRWLTQVGFLRPQLLRVFQPALPQKRTMNRYFHRRVGVLKPMHGNPNIFVLDLYF